MIARFVRVNLLFICLCVSDSHRNEIRLLQATVTNHSRNDSTIEQDYTEDFDLDLTNDNLFQNGNEPVEASVSIH